MPSLPLPKLQKRSANFNVDGLNLEARTIELSVSSEYEVARWGNCSEVLVHEPSAIRLGRLQNSAPLLFNHDQNALIGVVVAVFLDTVEKKLRVTARFSASEEANNRFMQVQEGVLTHVSIAYAIHQAISEQDGEGGPVLYKAIDWEPLEVSLVTVPADPTVGVGRGYALASDPPSSLLSVTLEDNSTPLLIGDKRTMMTTTPPAALTQAQLEEIRTLGKQYQLEGEALAAIAEGVTPEAFMRKALDVVATRQVEATPGQDRIDGILEVAKNFGFRSVANSYIVEGKSVEAFEDYVKSQSRHDSGNNPVMGGWHSGVADEPQYNLGNAIRALMSGDWSGAKNEREISVNALRQTNGTPKANSVYVPFSALRTMSVGLDSGTKGGSTVPVKFMGNSFIDYLGNALVLPALGADFITGLEGNGSVDFPSQTGATVANWNAEGATIPDSDMTMGKVTLNPYTLATTVDVTNQLLKQSGIDIEGRIRKAIADNLALGLQQAVINGDGAGKPLGIMNTSGVNSVAIGTNGGPITFDKMVDLEAAVDFANALDGNLSYLTNQKVKAALKKARIDSGSGLMVLGADGTANGYRVASTGQMPSNLTKGTSNGVCSAMIFGNWQDLAIGMWGGFELIYNPYSQSKKLISEFTANMLVGAVVKRPKSFAVCADITTA